MIKLVGAKAAKKMLDYIAARLSSLSDDMATYVADLELNLEKELDALAAASGPASHNLLLPDGTAWASYPTTWDSTQDAESGSVEFTATSTQLLGSYINVRRVIDTATLKPDTDYVLSFDLTFSVQGATYGQVLSQSELALRAAVCDASQKTFYTTWATPSDSNGLFAGGTAHKVFLLHTESTAPTIQMLVTVIFRSWVTGKIDITLSGVKLEEGTVATGFVPAGQDYQAAIDSLRPRTVTAPVNGLEMLILPPGSKVTYKDKLMTVLGYQVDYNSIGSGNSGTSLIALLNEPGDSVIQLVKVSSEAALAAYYKPGCSGWSTVDF